MVKLGFDPCWSERTNHAESQEEAPNKGKAKPNALDGENWKRGKK